MKNEPLVLSKSSWTVCLGEAGYHCEAEVKMYDGQMQRMPGSAADQPGKSERNSQDSLAFSVMATVDG